MELAGDARLELAEAALDSGVDVLVGVGEVEGTRVELLQDLAEALLDPLQLGLREQPRRKQSARVGKAAGDVERRQLDVDVERGLEALQLGQKAAPEASAPELAAGYELSLFTAPSPTSPARSRVCNWPWTIDAVRTPWPQSLMKPAAALWSKVSPFP